MSKSGKCLAALGAVIVLGFSSAAGSDTGKDLIEKSAPSTSARDYRAASATALRVASARSQVGETADACAALSQPVCRQANPAADRRRTERSGVRLNHRGRAL